MCIRDIDVCVRVIDFASFFRSEWSCMFIRDIDVCVRVIDFAFFFKK
jgi:hypothetical protein